LTHYRFCYRTMRAESWCKVGLLVILLGTAAATHHNVGCWVLPRNSWNKPSCKCYICREQHISVLSTETLDHNRICINLIHLSLVNNRIGDVKRDVFRNLEKLQFLYLSFNLISSLDEDVFSNLKSLEFLDLSFNYLSKLPDRLFSSQNRLKTLELQGNKLRTISLPLLTPLISIASLNLYNNQLLCECEVKLAMLWCKHRRMDTKATCQSQVLGFIYQWTQLEFFNICSENPVPSVPDTSVMPYTKSDDRVVANCPENPVPSVPDTSVTPYTKSDDRVVAVSSSYVVPLVIVVAVAFQFMCFGLLLLYLRRRRPPSVSTTTEERTVHSDSSSSHNCQFDYIQIPNNYTKPQLPSRPIQTIGDLVNVQVDTCHNGHSGIHLKEPTLFGTNTACDSCEEVRHMTEPESKKSHCNNKQPVRSGVTSSVSYDLPEYDNPSEMAVSNCNAINRSSDASVMVENCFYSV